DRQVELYRTLAEFSPSEARRWRRAARESGLALLCRHTEGYPTRLGALEAGAPATLHVAGAERLARAENRAAVAVVGTRRASPAGIELARELGRGLGAAGVTVISGMALGIDAAAHEGALAGGGLTVAVLPGPADRAYPVRHTRLHGRIREQGVLLSEQAPEAGTWRWAMRARNRLIAALADAVVVVEANTRSGALSTLADAKALGRRTAAVPGPVRSAHARGTNHAIAKLEAALVRGPQDVLDLLYGENMVDVPPPVLPTLTAEEATLLKRISSRRATVASLGADALEALSGLELKGAVVRGAGGVLTARV
ncbi:MAG: DNA-processing protein DprA, partial [Solirubrobacterales bacterium]|nr:DNA-processing protein DprA [Solirubrobacterales bacterium]